MYRSLRMDAMDYYIYNASIVSKLVNRIGTKCHNLDLRTDILYR